MPYRTKKQMTDAGFTVEQLEKFKGPFGTDSYYHLATPASGPIAFSGGGAYATTLAIRAERRNGRWFWEVR